MRDVADSHPPLPLLQSPSNPRQRIYIALLCSLGLLLAGTFMPALASALSRSPTLPPIHFPPKSGIRRNGQPTLLDRGNTFLGTTELVAFSSTLGLCIEIDHLRQRSRAGGCAFATVPAHRKVSVMGEGYNAQPGRAGVTEIFGEATASTQSILIEYQLDTHRHRTTALLGTLSHHIRATSNSALPIWFAADIPGCQERQHIHVLAFGPRHTLLGAAIGQPQRAACAAGSGYGVRGAVTFGMLPNY